MRKAILPTLGVFLTLSLFLVPAIALAHVGVPSQLVPCTNDCNVCHLYTLAHNIIDLLLWGIATPLLVVALLAAGFFWLTSAGSEEKITKGKSILFSAVVGFVIAFGAWVIINTIMDTLAFRNPFYGTLWTNTDFCRNSPFGGGVGTAPTTTTAPPPTGLPPSAPPPAAGTYTHDQAVAKLREEEINVVSTSGRLGCNDAGCTNLQGVQAETIQDAINLQNACNCTVIVGGGTETGSGHTESGACTHINGCKLDFQSNSALNSYIRSTYTRIENRRDGAEQYRNNDGTIYAWESNPPHWDMAAR